MPLLGVLARQTLQRLCRFSSGLQNYLVFSHLIVVMAVTWLPLQIKWVHKRKEMLWVW